MSLVSLFPSPVVLQVLSLFLTHPDERYYQRQVAELTGHSLLQVQHALERIEQAGLIRREKSGNRVYYHTEKGHPAFTDLQQALLKTDALGIVLAQAIQPFWERLQLAFVFGSIAKGEAGPESDIDLFLLGDIRLKELSTILSGSSEQLRREINPVIMTVTDYKERLTQKNRFALELLETPKIWLKGNQDEFSAVVE